MSLIAIVALPFGCVLDALRRGPSSNEFNAEIQASGPGLTLRRPRNLERLSGNREPQSCGDWSSQFLILWPCKTASWTSRRNPVPPGSLRTCTPQARNASKGTTCAA